MYVDATAGLDTSSQMVLTTSGGFFYRKTRIQVSFLKEQHFKDRGVSVWIRYTVVNISPHLMGARNTSCLPLVASPASTSGSATTTITWMIRTMLSASEERKATAGFLTEQLTRGSPSTWAPLRRHLPSRQRLGRLRVELTSWSYQEEPTVVQELSVLQAPSHLQTLEDSVGGDWTVVQTHRLTQSSIRKLKN